jgi:hypothetical protein
VVASLHLSVFCDCLHDTVLNCFQVATRHSTTP